MNETTCPGSCNRAYRESRVADERALRTWTETDPADRGDRPAKSRIEPVLGDPVWCGRCASGIRKMLVELDDLAAMYAAEADGHRSGPGGERVSGSTGRRSPSPAADDLDELYGVLHGWESALRGEDPQARRGFLANNITSVVTWLSSHFDTAISHPDIAPDFGQDVRRWHKTLRALTKAGADRHTKKRACPRCDLRTLTWREGDDDVECGNCGKLMALDDYEDYERMLAAANLSEAS